MGERLKQWEGDKDTRQRLYDLAWDVLKWALVGSLAWLIAWAAGFVQGHPTVTLAAWGFVLGVAVILIALFKDRLPVAIGAALVPITVILLLLLDNWRIILVFFMTFGTAVVVVTLMRQRGRTTRNSDQPPLDPDHEPPDPRS